MRLVDHVPVASSVPDSEAVRRVREEVRVSVASSVPDSEGVRRVREEVRVSEGVPSERDSVVESDISGVAERVDDEESVASAVGE